MNMHQETKQFFIRFERWVICTNILGPSIQRPRTLTCHREMATYRNCVLLWLIRRAVIAHWRYICHVEGHVATESSPLWEWTSCRCSRCSFRPSVRSVMDVAFLHFCMSDLYRPREFHDRISRSKKSWQVHWKVVKNLSLLFLRWKCHLWFRHGSGPILQARHVHLLIVCLCLDGQRRRC